MPMPVTLSADHSRDVDYGAKCKVQKDVFSCKNCTPANIRIIGSNKRFEQTVEIWPIQTHNKAQ